MTSLYWLYWADVADVLLASLRGGKRTWVLEQLDSLDQRTAMAVVARMMDSLVAAQSSTPGYEGRYAASAFMRLLTDRLPVEGGQEAAKEGSERKE